MNKILSTGLVTALLCMSGSVWAGEKIDQVVNTTNDGRVSIDVMNGKVKIRTWDKNEVRVAGELDDAAEGYRFESTESGRVLFKVEMPKRRWGSWKDDGSNLEFWIPINNELRYEGVNADVDVDGVMGGSRVNTVNGGIDANGLNGRIELETVNGKIKSKALSGKIKLDTVNGAIKDEDSDGEVQIETVNGDIRTTSKAQRVEISNVNGDMDLSLSKVKELEISTVNGDIDMQVELMKDSRFFVSTVGGDADIKFIGDVSAEFNIEAHSGGDIRNKLTKDKVKRDKYGPGESLKFQTGGGSAEVEIDTVGGDITIEK